MSSNHAFLAHPFCQFVLSVPQSGPHPFLNRILKMDRRKQEAFLTKVEEGYYPIAFLAEMGRKSLIGQGVQAHVPQRAHIVDCAALPPLEPASFIHVPV